MKRIVFIIMMVLITLSLFAKESINTKKSVPDSIKTPKITFIELGSVNCIPCKMMQPVMKAIEKNIRKMLR